MALFSRNSVAGRILNNLPLTGDPDVSPDGMHNGVEVINKSNGNVVHRLQVRSPDEEVDVTPIAARPQDIVDV